MVILQGPYSVQNRKLKTENKNELKQKCMFMSGQKLKFQKTCQNPFNKSLRVVLCKTPNIREMRPF